MDDFWGDAMFFSTAVLNRRLRRWTQITLKGIGGCDPYGVVEDCGGSGTRGLRPRAMRWVCSAYLKLLHPGRGAVGNWRVCPSGTESDGHGDSRARDSWVWRPPGTNPDREMFRVMRWVCSAYLDLEFTKWVRVSYPLGNENATQSFDSVGSSGCCGIYNL